MDWIICFVISMSALLSAIVRAVWAYARKRKRGRMLTPFMILLPVVYNCVLADAPDKVVKTIAFSLHNTLQIFTVDAEKSLITEIANCPGARLSSAYSVFLSAAYVVAPVLTFGFLVSFFKNLSAHLRYYVRFFRKRVFVFSELNEKSLALGADLRDKHPRAVIVYTDVFEKNDETSYELAERARDLRAICFKKDVLAIGFRRHRPGAEIVFFTIGENEAENIGQSLKLIGQYRNRKNTRLFVFSTRVESELLLTKAEKGRVKVRRVNEVRSLVNRLLYESGDEFFRNARPTASGEKKISAVIVGMGRHGTEMLKALAWYCQMDGYTVEIDAFDIDEKAEDKFTALAPELMSEKYNGVSVKGEAAYTIRFHSGYDVATASFADEISKLTEATYVFVSLGSDDLNIRTAVGLRMLFERVKAKPVIRAVIYGSEEKKALDGITNYRGQPYDIDFVGDVATSYSAAVIMNSELEAEALSRHRKWGEEEEFWQYEYNYNSSVASAIHRRARIACGIPGAEKSESELTAGERDAIESLEHRRWNAYMRSEGYVYSGSHEKSSRNDLAKMHHDLVDFSSLDEEEKRKDSRVGTK